MEKITITQPDDWHIHLRDGTALATTVPDAARYFGRVLAMPNLKPPVTTVAEAIAYQQRILRHVPEGTDFQPLISLYLTEQMSVNEIKTAKQNKFIVGCKLYPAGATTHSAAGIQKIDNIYPIFAAMEEHNIVLQIHGEVIDSHVDVFDREKYFLEQQLSPLLKRFPGLRIVLEHITTQEAVDFVTSAPAKLAATITAHHLLLNRNNLLGNGIRPHYFCLPIVKRKHHQEALIKAAISGNKKFFLGTDSAPHTKNSKESNCGCAGIYTAHAAIELYIEVFDQMNALPKLEGFASHFGADFYQLPRNKSAITLIKKPLSIPQTLPFGNDVLVPFRAGDIIHWQLAVKSPLSS